MANVTIYSTPTCPHCLAAKDFLKKNKIKFTNNDVSTDAKAAQTMIEKSGQQGVPVIDIDGEIVVGFDEPKLKEILKIK